VVPLKDLYQKDGLEANSVAMPVPTDAELVAWATDRLW
jgi:hypothetical protein